MVQQKQFDQVQPTPPTGGLKVDVIQPMEPIQVPVVEISSKPEVPISTGTINIIAINGACDAPLQNLHEGVTVGEIRDAVKELLNVRDDTEAYVNGQRVDETYVLSNEEQIEFMKPSGQKGA